MKEKGYLCTSIYMRGGLLMMPIYKAVLIYCLMTFFCFCSSKPIAEKRAQNKELKDTVHYKSVNINFAASVKSPMATKMDSLGLVELLQVDSTIHIQLMYAQPNNFTGQILYEDLNEAYLHPDAAKALVNAHKALKSKHPSYRFIIYDAARPMSAQKKMWNVVKGTPKFIYVSNPARGGGLHNYGLAVDISIIDSLGTPLPMGTKVDHFGPEAHITQENELVRHGKITEQEHLNRMLLRQIMKDAGFRALSSEWWHFNLCSREVARRNYNLIP